MTSAVLLIGGMDSSGGAGLVRDVATALSVGATPRVAVTAVTAQTDQRVSALHPVPAPVVAAQIAVAGAVGAVKVGMLCNHAIAREVAKILPAAPLVLDPVLQSSSGHALLTPAGMAVMLAHLLPRTAVLTPNLPEFFLLTRALLDRPPATEAEGVAALLATGCGAVLLKGGHAEDDTSCVDRLFLASAPASPLLFSGPRHPVTLRGTGCRLASAIASKLAQGAGLPEAVESARALLDAAFLAKVSEAVRPEPG